MSVEMSVEMSVKMFWHNSMPKADGERKVPILSTKLLTSNFNTLLFTAS